MESAFQTTDPFGGRYIEDPDPAYAPPDSGWGRYDTKFQLLVYYDPPPPPSHTARDGDRDDGKGSAGNEKGKEGQGGEKMQGNERKVASPSDVLGEERFPHYFCRVFLFAFDP